MGTGAGVGRRINLAIGIGFVLVLVVGGVSVLLAWAIARGVEEGRHRGLEVEALDRIHGLFHHFVGDLHLVLQGGSAPGHPLPEQVLRQLKGEIAAYGALEDAQGDREARQELVRLADLRALLARLETASTEAIAVTARGGSPTVLELAFLNHLAHEQVSGIIEELHALHRLKFQRAIDGSQRRIRLIALFYVAFAASGAFLLVLGNRFLSRTLVVPITRLGEAAHHIAGGQLSRRVSVGSDDEVGQLSRAFNLMAERLEAHEAERSNFEAELARQVKERTRQLEETTVTLRATQAQLIRSEQIALTGQIAAGVTHEIRTPLNSLAINVQLLRRELSGQAPPSQAAILDTLTLVEYEITRINRTLEEFVKFARLPTPRCERVEIGPLLEEILELLRPQAREAGVRLETAWTSAVGPVAADRDQLREVFLNLGQNALHAMPNGGTLDVAIGQAGEWVDIAVADRGPGVPEAEREHIFLPFVTTKADGLGLGLAIVKRIVEEHGGSVSCQNRVDGGAVFRVRLRAAGSGEEG
ncbi:MAG: HAMP domain-containing protein [Candidatus Rokubacteria bacterium]|nr:HAMP domain-containing protein [Candidatus Rokubacteria bacterium]